MRLFLALTLLLVAAPPALAADVNGDWLADMVVLGPKEGDNVRHSAFCVLGTRTPAAVDTAHPAPGTTYALRSAAAVLSASPLGDLDGDGLADLGVVTQAP